jgi:hypothetical protein
MLYSRARIATIGLHVLTIPYFKEESNSDYIVNLKGFKACTEMSRGFVGIVDGYLGISEAENMESVFINIFEGMRRSVASYSRSMVEFNSMGFRPALTEKPARQGLSPLNRALPLWS